MGINDLKIALVMPPSMTAEHGFSQVKCSYPGLGLVQVAGYLNRHGYDTQIIDLSNIRPTGEPKALKIDNCDVYGIGMYSESALGVDILCKSIRETNPGAKIIIGGHHATHEWKSVLAEYPNIYAVVVGDGEIPMENLIEGIADGNYARDYPGVAYKSWQGDYVFHGKYTNEDLQEVELDLGWLKKEYVCFPLMEYARRLFPQHPQLLERYLERNIYRKGCQSAGIITSRGCYARCSFCSFEVSRRYHKHRLEYVLDLLEWYADRGICNLVFYDSTFLADLSHVEEICQAMIDNNYNFKWTAQTQVHHEDKSIIKLMAEAGLVQMNLGLESGSPAIIHEMNKKFNINEFPGIVDTYKKAGIGVCANLIIGSPGENDQTVKETCKVFYHVDTDAIGEVQDLKLYPGSKWYFKAVRDGKLSTEWDWKAKGVPRFIFHGEKEIERWRITMEAHLRYALFFKEIDVRVDSIALLGFPKKADTSLLVEALKFSFPDCPIEKRLVPGCANLIICFNTKYPALTDVKQSVNDQLVWCSLDKDTFKLQVINFEVSA